MFNLRFFALEVSSWTSSKFIIKNCEKLNNSKVYNTVIKRNSLPSVYINFFLNVFQIKELLFSAHNWIPCSAVWSDTALCRVLHTCSRNDAVYRETRFIHI